MFGRIVLGVSGEKLDHVFDEAKRAVGATQDTDLTADTSATSRQKLKELVQQATGEPFPTDVKQQLELAIKAVFNSWMGKRAVDYRNEFKIAHDLGTAVNVVAMVFGNMGDDSGTGVAFTRDPSTGSKALFGEFLPNAQGEDVVAGIRTPLPISRMQEVWPECLRRVPADRRSARADLPATCRTWSSPSSAASCTCSRRATPSAPPAPRWSRRCRWSRRG